MRHRKGKYNAKKIAEACLGSGDKERAVHWHRKALEIDPTLQRWVQMLKTLAP